MAKTTTLAQKGKKAERQVKQAVGKPWVESLTRFGYFVRGVLYGLIGLLALGISIGSGNIRPNQTGAIAVLAEQPYGKPLLLLLAIGLASYAVWGLIRAVLDYRHEGNDLKGLLARAGYAVSGLTYASLVIPTVQILNGGVASDQSQKTRDMSAQLLSQPFGPWLLGLIGLSIIGAGVWQVYYGWKAKFKADLDSGMDAASRNLVLFLGQFGYAARGVVFGMTGWFLLQAALHTDPNKAQGLDGALFELSRQPLGSTLLDVAALGLLAFGLYSILAARWVRFNPAPKKA